MSKTLIYAIHGFLGQPSDWNETFELLKTEDSIANKKDFNFVAEDVFSKNQSIDFFWERSETFKNFQGQKFFLGYSMGGRLGLQILQKSPEMFDHFVFLSTNVGLPLEATDERQKRILLDKSWAEKISLNNWSTFLNEWNSQSVFNGSKVDCQREFKDYDILKLKESLTRWSLGLQEDFSDVIKKNNSKITWIVGDRDLKYCEMAENLKIKNILTDYEKISSGHRLWLDNPKAVVNILTKLI